MSTPSPLNNQLPMTAAKFQGFSDTARELFDRYEERIVLPPPITATGIAGFGLGAPPVQEIAASGQAAWHMSTTDQILFRIRLPRNFDVNDKILMRLLCSNDQAAATGSYIMVPLYNPHAVGDTQILPATACDVNPASQVDLAADKAQYTAYAQIVAGTAAIAALERGKDTLDVMWTAGLTTVTSVDVLLAEFLFQRLMV